MPGRQTSRLSILKVQKAIRDQGPRMLSDGGGLYLRHGRWWVFRFRLRAKSCEMGLGAATLVTLAEARTKTFEFRRILAEGENPLETRRAKAAARNSREAKAITFAEAARRYIDTHRAGWKSAVHAQSWENSLQTYANPVIGHIPAELVNTDLVLKVLEPIWTKKCETASRVRSRIELVLSWCSARGYRSGPNPAQWRGSLDQLLPKRSKVQPVQHHPALPIDLVPTFMRKLREADEVGSAALEFTIMTAARTSEVLGALWSEINFDSRIWTIPGRRMKTGKEHRVPLSKRAMEILSGRRIASTNNYIFPNPRTGDPLSNMTLLMILRRLGCKAVVHGFRSTFRDFSAERTNFPREVCECALAHRIQDSSERAYFRSDLFEKRRKLMDVWAAFCESAPAGSGVILEWKREPEVTLATPSEATV